MLVKIVRIFSFLLISTVFCKYSYASCEVIYDSQLEKSIEIEFEGLCNRLAIQDNKNINYVIFISSKDKEINAFAYEREKYSVVYITTSLLKEHNYDPRLMAFVVGHEMAHHSLGHVSENRLSKTLDRIKLSMLSALGVDIAGPASIAKFYIKSFENNFNRQQELAADKYSLYLMTLAGFKKSDALDSLNVLLGLSDSSHLKSFFSTHPDTRSRINNIQKN